MIETVWLAIEELAIAAMGGDWGYGALTTLVGDEAIAHTIVNAVTGLFA